MTAEGIGASTAAGVPPTAVTSTGIELRSTGTSIGAVTEPIGAALGERPDATGDDGLDGTGLSDETEARAESGRAPVTRLGAGGGTGSERVPLGAGEPAALGSLTGRLGAGGGTLRRGAGGGFALKETAAVPAGAGGGLLRDGRGGGLLRDGRGGWGAAEVRGALEVSPAAGAPLRLGAAGGIEFGRGRGGAGFFGEGESSAMTRVS